MSIPVVGIDGTSEALASISKGELTATVAQQPHDMTYRGIENALKVINGQEINKEISSGEDLVITEEKAEEKIKRSERLTKRIINST
ncbi:substrate-binding domain-containing protein [Peribacillus frigoritolerans]|nr:substrate-binding domain-containing protein [Peribacillus frigoritolerans]